LRLKNVKLVALVYSSLTTLHGLVSQHAILLHLFMVI
jgi:hypothetical protein